MFFFIIYINIRIIFKKYFLNIINKFLSIFFCLILLSVVFGAVLLLFSFILTSIRKIRSRWDQLDQLRSEPMEGENSSLPTLPLSATTPETDDGRIPW